MTYYNKFEFVYKNSLITQLSVNFLSLFKIKLHDYNFSVWKEIILVERCLQWIFSIKSLERNNCNATIYRNDSLNNATLMEREKEIGFI